MKLQLMYSFLRSDINVIEKELKKTVASEQPLVEEAHYSLLKLVGNEFVLYLCCLQGNLEIIS